MKFLRNIPKLPLTALIFYLGALLLWTLGIIPSPAGVVLFLEGLYTRFGYFGLFISAFLEGIVYLGLYFPGSFIIALAVFFSDGSFTTLLTISLVVAAALTITAVINYFLGKHVLLKKEREILGDKKVVKKGLFLSMLHPNLLAFYFFNEGLERENPWKIIFVPIIMIPYGLAFAYMLFYFADIARTKLEDPYFITILILIWLVLAFIIDHKRKIKKELNKLV